MKKNPRRISLLLAAAMVFGLLAAFPAVSVSAADTNYADKIVPVVSTVEDGALVAAVPDSSEKDPKIITDGDKTGAEHLYYFGSSAVYAVVFDLGSVKTDISSVYLSMRQAGNRQFPNPVKVYVGNENTDAGYALVETVADALDTSVDKWAQCVYHFTAAKSGRYVKLELHAAGYVTSFGEIEIRNYGLQSGPASSVATADPTLVDGNYAYQASYTVKIDEKDPSYRNAAQTDNGSMLTDGYESPNPSNAGVNGYTVTYAKSNSNVVMTFELKASHNDIGCVKFVNVPTPMTGGSFCTPKNVQIGVGSDGVAFTPVGAITTSTESKNNDAAFDYIYNFVAKQGSYVQVSFTMDNFLFGLDEVVVTAGAGAPVDPDPVINCPTNVVTSAAETNYALASKGAYYAYPNLFPDTASYKDDKWSRQTVAANPAKYGTGDLNDGIFADGSYNDSKWVGFLGSNTTFQIVFDLAHLYGDINQIKLAANVYDATQTDKVESIKVEFGDINGSYGQETTVTCTPQEENLVAADGKNYTRCTSQFAVAGPTAGARYVRLTFSKVNYKLFIDEIQIIGHSSGASSQEPVSSTEPSSQPESSETTSYETAPQFRTELSAEYGTFDADKNAANGNEFTGIAVTVSVVDIAYANGIFSVEGKLSFDGSKLSPLYTAREDLNNGVEDDLKHTPKPVLSWPTTAYDGETVFNVDGLCKPYAAGGNELDICYSFHNMPADNQGVKTDGAMKLRYYFTVPAGQEGQTFTFTVPDAPGATQPSEYKIYTFGIPTGATITDSVMLPGQGGSASVTVPVPVVKHSVTFKDWNGDVISVQQVVDGEDAIKPDDPVREGFDFTGWDKAFTNVKTDLEITAEYTAKRYTVSIVVSPAEGGTVSVSALTATYGQELSNLLLAVTATANEGWTFAGFTPNSGAVTSDFTVTAGFTQNAPAVDFFTFKSTADLTYVVKDDVNGYLKFYDGLRREASLGLRSVEEIKAMFEDPAITVAKTEGGAALADTSKATTGYVMTSTINGESRSMTIVVVGDVDGNKKINSTDYDAIAMHVNHVSDLTGAGFVAAAEAMSPTGKVKGSDYDAIAMYVAYQIERF